MSGRLSGKIALITGGTRGIGLSIAQLFEREGATVIISGSDRDRGISALLELSENIIFIPLDVSSESDWNRVVSYIWGKFGRLDILVNNAGISAFGRAYGHPLGPQDPEHATLSSLKAIFNVNVDGVFLGCKFALSMMRNGGSIVNMSSRSGLVGRANDALYAASKAAVESLTKSVAAYGSEKTPTIRCNSVCPGAIATEMWGSPTPAQMLTMASQIPLKIMGDPADVANAVLYLVSDEAKFVTGASLIVDGGLLVCAGSKS